MIIKVLYGMPTSGKTTLRAMGLPGIDTDDVRRVYGLRKNLDDDEIFLRALQLLIKELLFGNRVWLYTNLVAQIEKFADHYPFGVYCLPVPSDEQMVMRLSARDGTSITEAQELVKTWRAKHMRERKRPKLSRAGLTFLEDVPLTAQFDTLSKIVHPTEGVRSELELLYRIVEHYLGTKM